MLKLILPIFLFSQLCAGQPVVYLNVGQEAPFSGYLLSPAKEKEVRTQLADYDRLQNLSKAQTELIGILNNRIEVKESQVQNLNSQLSRQESISSFQKWIYFGVGALATGLVINYIK